MGINMGRYVKDLVKKAQIGDREALGEIISRFTPFVVKMSSRIYVKGYELEDLVQIGQVSIIKTVKMYDLDRGEGFTAYAINTVKKNFYRLIKYKVRLSNEYSFNDVNVLGREFIETLSSEDKIEETFIKKYERLNLYEGIKRLSLRERGIILWFYFKNRTLEEYAREHSITYRAAVERKRVAIKKLRIMIHKVF